MPRGSKERLLKSAMHVFALKGFQGTSTREIAGKAKLNISAITYYFGGKKGLYQAVMENIVQRVKSEIENDVRSAEDVLASKTAGASQAEEKIYALISVLSNLLYSHNLPDEAVVLFLHEYASPGEAFQTLYDGLISPIYKIFADLVIRATDNAVGCEQAALYAFQIFADMFVFRTRKKTILHYMQWKDYGEKEIAEITQMTIRHTRAVLALYRNKNQ